jgi:hypothetical protein
MKKVIAMIALAAFCLGSASAMVPVKAVQQDTTKKEKKNKDKEKTKKDTSTKMKK